jgi:transposase
MRQPSVFVGELLPAEGAQLKRIARAAKQFARRQRAQSLLASASGMSAPQIAAVVRTDENQVRRVVHEFNQAGMDSLRPFVGGGRPRVIPQPTRDRIVAIAGACPGNYGGPLTRWSLRRLRCYLLRRRIVPQLSVEGLRQILRAAGCSWQRTRTWKRSPDPDYEAKAARVLRLYRAAEDGRAARHQIAVVCLDECGPLSLRPWPGSAWAPLRRPVRTRATYHRPHGVRYLLGNFDVGADRLRGHLIEHKDGPSVLAALRRLRAGYPRQIALFVVMDNLSAHWTHRSASGRAPIGSAWSRCRPMPATSTASSVTSGPTWSSSFAARTMPATTSWPMRPARTCATATPPITIHRSESRKTGARLPDTPLGQPARRPRGRSLARVG